MQCWQHCLLGGVLMALALSAHAVSIATDDWTYDLAKNASSITNAGDYYSSTHETTTSIGITGLGLTTVNWTLQARTTVTQMNLAIKRTGSGTGDGTISGGENYLTLNSAYRTIFTGTGTGSRLSIPLIFQISNFDVTDGNGTKNIPIEYQVTTQ